MDVTGGNRLNDNRKGMNIVAIVRGSQGPRSRVWVRGGPWEPGGGGGRGVGGFGLGDRDKMERRGEEREEKEE